MLRNSSNEHAVDGTSLAALFLARAKRYDTKVLYRFWRAGQWQSLTWNDALIRVKELALGLVSLGVSRGDRVAIFSGNCVEWLLVDWANICIGALSVPIYASISASQAVHIIGHSDPAVLIVDSLSRLEKLDFARTGLSELKAIIHFNDNKMDKNQNLSAKTLSIETLREMGRAYETRHPGVFELLAQSLRPRDDLTIIYTSGTTGVPKGVLTTHANYLFMIQAVDAAVPSSDRDVTLHFLPTAHSFGRLEHFMAVAKGWTLGVARSVETIPIDLRTIRPSVLFSVPRIYENAHHRIRRRLSAASSWRRKVYEWSLEIGKRRLELRQKGVESGWSSSLAFSVVDRLIFARVRAAFGGRLRLAISGGAPLAADIALFFRAMGIAILEGYGSTETSTVSHVNRPDNFRLGTVGLPISGTECRIADDGEILLRGPHIFKSYFRDWLATEEVVDSAGWFHTGDIGSIDAAGFLTVTDRKRDLIVTSGGKKVAPQKVENLLKTDPLINQVLVVGRGQPHLLALITLDRKRVEELAKEKGMVIDTAKALASHSWLHDQVREIIQRANKELAPFEAVRNFSILDHDFTIEREELTPTLKPRRQVIVERYKDLIENLYRKAS
jgi:long-chain acyl-CoA synthetase